MNSNNNIIQQNKFLSLNRRFAHWKHYIILIFE